MGFAFDEQFSTIAQLTDEQAAYLAGLIDADGTITLQARRKPNGDGTAKIPVPMVLVVNTNLSLIEWLKEMLGFGCAYETKSKPTRPDQNPANWNKVHRFQITGRSAQRLIEKVRPHLRVKAEQAELLLKIPVRGVHFKSRATLEQRREAMAVLDRVRSLNARK